MAPDQKKYNSPADLMVQHGEKDSPFSAEINEKWFLCCENDMGIQRIRFVFLENSGIFEYVNGQGSKQIKFGMGYNIFDYFPQRGYSDSKGNIHDDQSPFLLQSATSGAWIERQKLMLRVQIIDRYFGSVMMTFGFRDSRTVGIRMIKTAEDFLNEYNGWAIGYAQKE